MRLPNLALAFLLAAPLGASRALAQTTQSPDRLFDGAKPHDGDAAGPLQTGAADPDGLDAKQRALLDGLLARVELKPGDDPRAPALLHETFVRLVRTPTGAEMSARFIAENARAVVEFGVHLSSAVRMVNGKAVLLYSGGDTDTSKHPPVIMLNQGYLETDPAWRGPEMTGTLGHEMFGHAFERQRADKAGVTSSLNHYRGDEANAGLLGWLIELEAGAPADDGNMWNYIQDPEAYHRNLETLMAYYAGTFSVADMKNPLATLKDRRDRVDQARARLHQRRESTDNWRPVVEHFIEVHGMSRDDFSNILASIDGTDKFTETEDKEYVHIQSYIDSLSAHWSGDGAAELATISAESGSPYYVGTEERLQVLRGRLKDLTANRKPEPSAPPVPGQITWDQLSDMYEKDLKDHPEHWSK